MMRDHEWRVHIAPDFATGQSRLVAIAMRGGHEAVLKSFDEDTGVATMEALAEGVAIDTESLPLLPKGLAEAIAEAVKPGPAQAVVDNLEKALKYERMRVDHVLEKVLDKTLDSYRPPVV